MKFIFPFILLIIIACPSLADTGGKGDHQWWIKAYGRVTARENPAVKRATRVFNRTWRAAQPVKIPKPRLIILPLSAEKWLDSWAISIADGSIIMVESLLPLVFEVGENSEKYGDSRLAFVLSHELAHLVHKDHEKLGVPMLFQALSGEEEVRTARTIEVKADYKGMFIMTMAGYNPRNILKTDSVFFNEYARKVRKKIRSIGSTADRNHHPESEIRADDLRDRLKPFADRLKIFYKGIEAYHALNLEKAEELFLQFLEVYPGRETLNNLGLTLYQKSRHAISGCKGIQYKLIPATELVSKTDAELLVPEETHVSVEVHIHPICQPERFQEAIVRAEKYLLMARKKAADFRPALVNLTALQITKRNYEAAESEAESLLARDSFNPHAMNNRALALFLMDSKQNRQQSVELLRQVPDSSGVFELATRNLEMITQVKSGSMGTSFPKDSGISPDILESID